MHWAFVAVRAFSSCGAWGGGVTLRCSAWASCRGDFSCGTQVLDAQASGAATLGPCSCSLLALEHGLRIWGTQAELLRGMWDLPRPGIRPLSAALAGGFLSGKSSFLFFFSRQKGHFLSCDKITDKALFKEWRETFHLS